MIRLAGRRLGVALVLSVGLWIAGLWVGARWIYYELPMLVAAAIKDPIYDPTRFSLITLRSPQLVNPTTLQFGPDGALYVGTRNGLILRLTLSAMGSAIHVTSEECIGAIQEIPNHDDDGHLQPEIRTRLVTGIAVTGTASNPVLYVSSSDPRIDQDGTDTNSGVLSRLDRGSEGWKRTDLVRGLPRSRSDHAPHGIALDPVRPILYLTVGSNTNLGAPSHPFRLLPEYSLSASILSIDLARIGDTTYDLPTHDDSDRPGVADANDPFGGNTGRNQALLVSDGPVQIYAEGLRNAYDVVLTPSGMFTVDNGANDGFGGPPASADASPATPVPGGKGAFNPLYFIPGPGGFFGHPNLERRKPADKPIAPLHQFRASTNGMAVYSPSDGKWDHRLLAISVQGTLSLVRLDAKSEHVESWSVLLANLPGMPLDVWSQNASTPMPGTIWIADFGESAIYVLAPISSTSDSLGEQWRELPRAALARLLLYEIAFRHDLLDTLREWRMSMRR